MSEMDFPGLSQYGTETYTYKTEAILDVHALYQDLGDYLRASGVDFGAIRGAIQIVHSHTALFSKTVLVSEQFKWYSQNPAEEYVEKSCLTALGASLVEDAKIVIESHPTTYEEWKGLP